MFPLTKRRMEILFSTVTLPSLVTKQTWLCSRQNWIRRRKCPRRSSSSSAIRLPIMRRSSERECFFQASGNLVTTASVVGGIAAQEAMKAVTHHMTPLKQWLYIDHIEALPGNWTAFDTEQVTEDMCKPVRIFAVRLLKTSHLFC